MPVQPLFLDTTAGFAGRRFALVHPAGAASPRGLVVHVHAFAEEMNKARRMVALQARALAADGYLVLQIDLHGCGDSAGDFGDAQWQGWVDDVVHACRWLRERAGAGSTADTAPLWLWGLRTGALIAAQAASQLAEPCQLLLWQPVVAGKSHLQQFLRVHSAAEMLAGQKNGTGAVAALKARLQAGERIAVAGYMLQPALCKGLEEAALAPFAPRQGQRGRIAWLEVSSAADGALSPASQAASAAWQGAGWQVHTQVAQGPAFWQTTEIEDAPALLAATRQVMKRAEHMA